MTAAEYALSYTARLLAFSAILHAIEFWRLRSATGPNGVWRWKDLQTELVGHSRLGRRLLSLFLDAQPFQYLNIIRLLFGFFVLYQPFAFGLWALTGLHLLTLLRWLGTFNGGSDYMFLMLLVGTSLGFSTSNPDWQQGALWYMAIQLCLSYFRAGLAKIRHREWWNGSALRYFLLAPHYDRSIPLQNVLQIRLFSILGAWTVILFEITFPLSLFNPWWASVYIATAILFHLSNVYLLGLNRFFWAWLAAYPSLLFCASTVSMALHPS